MRLLIAGGTSFVGRAVALAALDSGHEVTVVNRGVTPSDLPPQVTRLVGDRQGDLSALSDLSFDATVDTIAYRPSDVAALHDALSDRGGHHLQISSVSAYTGHSVHPSKDGAEPARNEPMAPGATEATAALWAAGSVSPDAPITGETYGPLKAECERAASMHFGADVTIVRPTYVIGGHDATLRFPYWVQRCQRGGDVAVPGPRDVALQYVDARDLGAFVVTLLETSTTGAFHAAGPWPAARYVEVIEEVARVVAPAATRIVEVAPEAVAAAGLEAKMQLWSGPVSEGVLGVDPSAAMAAGLTLRPLADSVTDVVEWWGDREWPARWMTPAEETALLSRGA